MPERDESLPHHVFFKPGHTQEAAAAPQHSPSERRTEAAQSMAEGAGSGSTEMTELATASTTRRKPSSVVPTDASMLEPGQLLGIYRITRRLDSGSMGIVYEAIDTERDSRVALKTLRRFEPRGLYRLKQEFRRISDISHPNLVQMHELLGWQGIWFFTMDFVDGIDFLRHICGAPGHTKQPSIAALPDAARLRHALRQLVHGILALHEAGIVHCDLKPSNVLVEKDRVAILDFGIARTLGAALPITSTSPHEGKRRLIVGTPSHLAPEQARGDEPEPASDWYAVGTILFQALTGTLPFTGTPDHIIAAKLRQDASHPISLRPELSADLCDLADVCWHLLARSPRERPNGTEILARLGEHAQRSLRPKSFGPVTPIGRGAEAAALRDAYETAAAGKPVCAYVSGPPGIGKSTLVQHVLRSLPDTVRIFAGRCYEREAVPFKVFDSLVDELRDYLDALPLADQQALIPAELRETARIFPVLRSLASLGVKASSLAPEETSVELRQEAFLGLKRLLGALCHTAPVILFIDDIQWGDRDSVALLIEVLSPPGAPPLLIVGTYRDYEAQHSPFFQEWLRQTQNALAFQVLEIPLAPLDTVNAAALVTAIWPNVDPAQTQSITGEADGNPFFIEELIRHAHASGPASTQPIGISQAVAARVDSLPAEARRLLHTVAIAGRPIEQRLAARACGVENHSFQHLGLLRALSLVRTRGGRGSDPVEAYHDRIRESIVSRLTSDETREIHHQLAHVLSGKAPAEVLAYHCHGAGELDQAAEYAAQAADQAANALAFERAAALYAQALDWGTYPSTRARALSLRRAHALFNAGRCADAAPLFLREAAHADANQRDLRRRAAESYLIAGHIDDGLRVVAPLLQELGVAYPRNSWDLARQLACQFGRLILRGAEFEVRDGVVKTSGEELARADLCWSLSKGLSVVMPLQGMHFTLSCLLRALDQGDTVHVGQALACLGTNLWGFSSRWGKTYVDRARLLSERHDSPELRATVLLWQSGIEIFRGHWSEAVASANRALVILREACKGIAWEENIALGVVVVGLMWMGRFHEAFDLANLGFRMAEQRGDLYGQVLATQNAAICNIARGSIDRARQQARWVLDRWTKRQRTIQHAYSMRLEAYCDLYEGAPARAAQRFLDELQSGPLWYRQTMRSFPDFVLLEAAIRLSLSERDAAARKLQGIEVLARKLEKSSRRDGAAHAMTIRSAHAARRGDLAGAISLLERVSIQFESIGMPLDAACARARTAALVRDASLGREARAYLARQGIEEPDNWLRIMAPGFTPP